jgi:hypothetical protein
MESEPQHSQLRQLIKDVIKEDLKNTRSKHEKTVAGSIALRRMHDAPGVLEALSQITEPRELAHVIEAIIDAVPVVRRDEVLRALLVVQRHEKKTRRLGARLPPTGV